jgi:hypothetical protein
MYLSKFESICSFHAEISSLAESEFGFIIYVNMIHQKRRDVKLSPQIELHKNTL